MKSLKPPFEISYMEVTPELAQKWLQRNPKNRNMRKEAVQAYARDMKRGAWCPNHQGIAIDANGDLLDGQHRLAALVRANVTLPMLVFTGVPVNIDGVNAKTMETVDRGTTRLISDMLRIQYGIKQHANFVAAMIVTLAQIMVGSGRARRVSMPQTSAILELFADDLRWVSENRPTMSPLSAALVGGAVAFARNVIGKPAEEFYQAFGLGVGLSAGGAVLVLRNYILGTDALRGDRTTRRRVAQVIVACIDHYAKGRAIDRVPKSGEAVCDEYLKRCKYTEAVEEIFPTMDGDQLEEPAKGALPELPTNPPEPSPSQGKILSAKDVKLTPLAESILRGKEMQQKLKRRGVEV